MGCVGAAPAVSAGVVEAVTSFFSLALALGFLGNEYLVVMRVEG